MFVLTYPCVDRRFCLGVELAVLLAGRFALLRFARSPVRGERLGLLGTREVERGNGQVMTRPLELISRVFGFACDGLDFLG